MLNRMIRLILLINIIYLLLLSSAIAAIPLQPHPVEQLVGEELAYDVSFLWFKRLAEGTIRLERGEAPGTYLATMEARTRGFAALVTKHRIEKYQTVMEVGPDGLLRPLLHSSHTFKGQGEKQKEKLTSYRFDYETKQVHYQKVKYRRVAADELLPLEVEGPVFDILSAFYNLRLESFGAIGNQEIHMPTFHRKGVEDIVVAPAGKLNGSEKKFFASNGALCKVLVDPSVFKTKGRELFVSFDKENRLERGIIKNVIGLGDVKGILRQVSQVANVVN